MADSFVDQLRSELEVIRSELDRLAAKRLLIEELLGVESSAAIRSARAQLAGRRRAPTPAAAKRPRRERGLITGKIREFLGERREPAHGTEILAFLEREGAAPLSAKPMATLQSALQRLKEQGEIENMGRNRWRMRAGSATESDPAPTMPEPGPPVVTSTTTFRGPASTGQ